MKISTAVFIVFLVLKLTGVKPVSDWSWWWVTSPLWIGLALLIIFAVIAFVATTVVEILK